MGSVAGPEIIILQRPERRFRRLHARCSVHDAGLVGDEGLGGECAPALTRTARRTTTYMHIESSTDKS